MKRKDGQYVELYWECDPAFEMVMGWVSEETTRQEVESFAMNDYTRSWKFRQCYAMNLQTALCREEGLYHEVRLYNEAGRGRYKVSVLEPSVNHPPRQGVAKEVVK